MGLLCSETCNFPSYTPDFLYPKPLTISRMQKQKLVEKETLEANKECSNSVWVKTSDNCYVSETGLLYPADRFILANCGPIGFLQTNYTGDNDIASTARIGKAGKSSKAIARSTVPLPEPLQETETNGNFLINLTVGSDFADCRSCANITCGIQERFYFNQTVLAQCYQQTTSTNPNETYWYETTDFCFMKTVDFWQSLDDGMIILSLCPKCLSQNWT